MTIILGLLLVIILLVLVLPIVPCDLLPLAGTAFTLPGEPDEGPQVIPNFNLILDSIQSWKQVLFLTDDMSADSKDELLAKIDAYIPPNYNVTQYGFIVDGNKKPVYLTYNVRKFYKLWAVYYFDELGMRLNFQANKPLKLKKNLISTMYTV